MTTEQFDTIVIGAGPGGEVAVSGLRDAGKRIAVVERELIGGGCGYWACIPSKTLLRPPEAKVGADRAAGVAGAQLDWPAIREYRDYMIRYLDDSKQVAGYEKSGVTVVKGEAQVTGTVEVAGRRLSAAHLIVATGSDALVPPIEGLADVPVWTNREATTLTDIPGRVVLIGGSAVAVELGQFLRRFGADVTLVERSDRLLSREDPRVGALVQTYLRDEGVTVLTNTNAVRARRDADETVVELDNGDETSCDVIVVGTGRTPRTAGLGLDRAGVQLGDHGQVLINEHCQAADRVWAIGDVTAVMPFTHVAKYQAQVAVANILGTPRSARYEGFPEWCSATPRSPRSGSPGSRPRSRAGRSPPPRSTSPRRSAARTPMRRIRAATWRCWPTGTPACCWALGR